MNEYFYGVGRIRALEAKMLSPAQIARMSAAADFQSAFAVLPETPYAEHLTKLKHPFDFEELCELERLALKNLLDHLAPENEIITTLFRKYDYQNLKILIRSMLGAKKGIELYSRAGTLAIEKLKLFVFEGLKEPEEKEISEAIEDAKTSYEKNKDPQSIDLSLDQRYFSYLKQVCSTSPSQLIREMVNYKIDLTNIKTLFRLQELKKDKKFLETALLEPGFIDKDLLLELSDKGPQEIISKLNFTPYFPQLTEGIDHFAKTKSFYLLEKIIDNFVIEQFKKAKYLSSGLEPLIGFYLAKESEIKTVRFILICKKNYVQAERIKERLRMSYA